MDAVNPNIAVLLAERAARHPERTALVEYRRGRAHRLTFRELERGVAALVAELQAAGIGPGDRVLVFVPMSAALYRVLLACFHLGAPALFVDAWADRYRLDAAVRAAQPQAFIGSPKAQLLRLLSPAIRRLPLHLIARAADPWRGGCAPTSAHPVAADDPALITFTTGSTGQPKAAARSHAFLRAQHAALAAYLQPQETDIDFPTLPIFVLNNLALGVTTVLPDWDPRRPTVLNPAAIHRQLLAEKVTTASGSPAFFARLAEWSLARGERLPLRALFTGGAPVLPPLARRLQEAVTGEVHVVYGSTEAEPIAGLSATELLAAGDGDDGLCAGRPVSGLAVRLLHPTDGPIRLSAAGWTEWEAAPGEAGEIVVSGGHVLGGYLNSPEAEAATKIRDGDCIWHRTGDAARFDAHRRLRLLGRVGERVRREGQVWWPLPVEMQAGTLLGITHAAYLGMPAGAGEQRAVLCVEAATGRLSPADDAALREAIAPAPLDELRIFRHLPRDPRHASKTDMEVLRQRLTPGTRR
jgi:acyl-CoA synthetase (AMP-forming)/AMP-acid ligase II